MIGKTALTVLPNGCLVVTSEMPGVESVSLCFDAGVGGRFETAEELGISVEACKKRIQRAKARLRERLK